MANSREFYVISKDGTIIQAVDCVLLHANQEQLDTLDAMPDNERFDTIMAFEDTTTVWNLAWQTIMEDIQPE